MSEKKTKLIQSSRGSVFSVFAEEELKQKHSKMMHGGFVLRSGNTGDNKHLIEYSLKLDSNPEFTAGDMHSRECFVVLEDGADQEAVAETIRTMPGYFAPYKTTVNFVSQEELDEKFKTVHT